MDTELPLVVSQQILRSSTLSLNHKSERIGHVTELHLTLRIGAYGPHLSIGGGYAKQLRNLPRIGRRYNRPGCGISVLGYRQKFGGAGLVINKRPDVSAGAGCCPISNSG